MSELIIFSVSAAARNDHNGAARRNAMISSRNLWPGCRDIDPHALRSTYPKGGDRDLARSPPNVHERRVSVSRFPVSTAPPRQHGIVAGLPAALGQNGDIADFFALCVFHKTPLDEQFRLSYELPDL
jgi:hypothetical protein